MFIQDSTLLYPRPTFHSSEYDKVFSNLGITPGSFRTRVIFDRPYVGRSHRLGRFSIRSERIGPSAPNELVKKTLAKEQAYFHQIIYIFDHGIMDTLFAQQKLVIISSKAMLV